MTPPNTKMFRDSMTNDLLAPFRAKEKNVTFITTVNAQIHYTY